MMKFLVLGSVATVFVFAASHKHVVADQEAGVAVEGNAAGNAVDIAVAVDASTWEIVGPVSLQAKTGDENSGGGWMPCDLGNQHRCQGVSAGFSDAKTFTSAGYKTMQIRFVPDNASPYRGRMTVTLRHK
jgi:hypothetical protein